MTARRSIWRVFTVSEVDVLAHGERLGFISAFTSSGHSNPLIQANLKGSYRPGAVIS
jgi:hypothetical protein